jgi:hypothetical protein
MWAESPPCYLLCNAATIRNTHLGVSAAAAKRLIQISGVWPMTASDGQVRIGRRERTKGNNQEQAAAKANLRRRKHG